MSAAHLPLQGGVGITHNKAAFFDLDGTLTKAHVWHGMLEYFRVHKQRQWTHRVYMAYHMPLYILRKLGIISEGAFRKPWPAHLGWYVRGYTLAEADQVWNWVIDNYMDQHWRADTCQILEQHRENEAITVLVSGTPVPLLKRIAEKIGADHAVGTSLEVQDGRYTGHSIGPACIDDNKVSLTNQYMDQNGIHIDYPASYAYADSISDQSMLEIVGHPVATYPDENLLELAQERGWQIFPSE
jgi:HAD superfamily hydrolase (TIGR01490 family)